jgi:hypothetical protein
VFIEDPPANSMSSFNSAAIPEEGTTFVFSSWVLLGLHCQWSRWLQQSHCHPRKLETPSLIFSQNVSTLVGSSQTRLSDLIGNYASRLRAIPPLWISTSDLIAEIDLVDRSIAGCIKLTEAALRRSCDLAPMPWNHSETRRQLLPNTGDIFSGINQVN